MSEADIAALIERANAWATRLDARAGGNYGPTITADVSESASALRECTAALAALSETWTDENGTTWRPPTAWAYAQCCRVRDALQADAARYQHIRRLTRGAYGVNAEQTFLLPHVEPASGANIMRGSVAQHLDAAIDEAMK